MYLSIGKTAVIPEETIIGIFDLDICSRSYLTREFLAAAEKAGAVENAAEEDIPNSFLVCTEKEGSKVLLSQSTSRTLYRRMKQTEEERRTTWQNTMN